MDSAMGLGGKFEASLGSYLERHLYHRSLPGQGIVTELSRLELASSLVRCLESVIVQSRGSRRWATPEYFLEEGSSSHWWAVRPRDSMVASQRHLLEPGSRVHCWRERETI